MDALLIFRNIQVSLKKNKHLRVTLRFKASFSDSYKVSCLR